MTRVIHQGYNQSPLTLTQSSLYSIACIYRFQVSGFIHVTSHVWVSFHPLLLSLDQIPPSHELDIKFVSRVGVVRFFFSGHPFNSSVIRSFTIGSVLCILSRRTGSHVRHRLTTRPARHLRSLGQGGALSSLLESWRGEVARGLPASF